MRVRNQKTTHRIRSRLHKYPASDKVELLTINIKEGASIAIFSIVYCPSLVRFGRFGVKRWTDWEGVVGGVVVVWFTGWCRGGAEVVDMRGAKNGGATLCHPDLSLVPFVATLTFG